MRARQNVFSATFRGNAREEKRMRDETMALLVEQGLEKYKDDIATSLPYGIQRRLEIARALANFAAMILGLLRASKKENPLSAQLTSRVLFVVRMVVLLVVLVIALKSKRFDPLATLLPLCFMRLALMASELVRKKKKGVPAA